METRKTEVLVIGSGFGGSVRKIPEPLRQIVTYFRLKGGIHLLGPATRCSIPGWLRSPDRILLAALTIPEPCRSSTIGSPRKRRVWRICGGFGGGRASDARNVPSFNISCSMARRVIPYSEIALNISGNNEIIPTHISCIHLLHTKSIIRFPGNNDYRCFKVYFFNDLTLYIGNKPLIIVKTS